MPKSVLKKFKLSKKNDILSAEDCKEQKIIPLTHIKINKDTKGILRQNLICFYSIHDNPELYISILNIFDMSKTAKDAIKIYENIINILYHTHSIERDEHIKSFNSSNSSNNSNNSNRSNRSTRTKTNIITSRRNSRRNSITNPNNNENYIHVANI